MIRLAMVLLWMFPAALLAEVYPALHEVTGVAAGDVLNVRERPDGGSAILGALAPGAAGVEVMLVTDGWGLVNIGDSAGYVSMRFLERADGPDWNALKTPLTCLGTEPFWSLQIDPAKGQTLFQTPEDSEPFVAQIAGSWPALPWSPVAAVDLPDGIAVLAPTECSDGMSEQSYGISADLFLTGPGRTRLSGCCRLGLR